MDKQTNEQNVFNEYDKSYLATMSFTVIICFWKSFKYLIHSLPMQNFCIHQNDSSFNCVCMWKEFTYWSNLTRIGIWFSFWK